VYDVDIICWTYRKLTDRQRKWELVRSRSNAVRHSFWKLNFWRACRLQICRLIASNPVRNSPNPVLLGVTGLELELRVVLQQLVSFFLFWLLAAMLCCLYSWTDLLMNSIVTFYENNLEMQNPVKNILHSFGSMCMNCTVQCCFTSLWWFPRPLGFEPLLWAGAVIPIYWHWSTAIFHTHIHKIHLCFKRTPQKLKPHECWSWQIGLTLAINYRKLIHQLASFLPLGYQIL
jgi:hypothetical protein